MLLFLMLVQIVASSIDEAPESLRRAYDARSHVQVATGAAEYSLVQKLANDISPPHRHFYSWKTAGDRFATVDHGAEDGVVRRGPDGRAAPITYDGPVSSLTWDGKVWMHAENDPQAHAFLDSNRDRFALFDLRTLGLNPAWDFGDYFEDVAKHGLGPIHFTETRDGEQYLVEGRIAGGSVQWWIDPNKNWGITRTAVFVDGKQIGDTRFTLHEVDGVWMPKKMERVRLGSGETEPSDVLEVLHAEYNQPHHPIELTPTDIGVEVGTPVIGQEEGLSSGRWDGDSLVSSDEFNTRALSGELRVGPRLAREMARRQAAVDRKNKLDAVPGDPSKTPLLSGARPTAWQEFTAKVIATYALTDEQSQKAWSICRECEERGAALLPRIEQELAQLDKLLAEKNGEPDGHARARKRRDELLEPINRVFDRELRPRLLRLPTRKQIETAESRGKLDDDVRVERDAVNDRTSTQPTTSPSGS